ncbi:hypothetical protein [Streptomyces xantholiticus]|uniref:Uncharacterized protein n=1 Tax=Streptomyces xantholiticus TaxID=68285 RepID=A0ABV1V4R9_9ACTN
MDSAVGPRRLRDLNDRAFTGGYREAQLPAESGAVDVVLLFPQQHGVPMALSHLLSAYRQQRPALVEVDDQAGFVADSICAAQHMLTTTTGLRRERSARFAVQREERTDHPHHRLARSKPTVRRHRLVTEFVGKHVVVPDTVCCTPVGCWDMTLGKGGDNEGSRMVPVVGY